MVRVADVLAAEIVAAEILEDLSLTRAKARCAKSLGSVQCDVREQMCDRFDVQFARVEPPCWVVLVQPPCAPLRTNRANQRCFRATFLTRHSHEPIGARKDEQGAQRMNVLARLYQ